MNLASSDNLAAVSPAVLPPLPGGVPLSARRASLLFMTSFTHGWRSYADELLRATEPRADLQAVHVRLHRPTWFKVWGKFVPAMKDWDFAGYRSVVGWKWLLGSWFRGALPPERFDLVQITTQTNALALAAYRERHGAGPKAVTVIDQTAVQYAGLGRPAIPQKPVIAAERRVCRAMDMVTCFSEWARQSVINDYGVAPERTTVARQAVRMPAGFFDRPVRREPQAGRKVRLVYVGNEWVRKGGDRLVRWHQEHFADRAELHVLGAGVPVDTTCKNIIWHGSVPREKLLTELLPSMDVFVLPTIFDQLPWALVEAAAVGLPILTTRMAAIPEIAADGRNALLAEVSDERGYLDRLDQLIRDEPLRHRLGDAGRAEVMANWTAERCYPAYLDRLLGLIGR
jgi:glycosyltransferase involved in cell wall biosynthesis